MALEPLGKTEQSIFFSAIFSKIRYVS